MAEGTKVPSEPLKSSAGTITPNAEEANLSAWLSHCQEGSRPHANLEEWADEMRRLTYPTDKLVGDKIKQKHYTFS